jgi:hypothetical protein
MGTPYSDIFELFLASVRDYKLDDLMEDSQSSLETYLKPLLIKAIPNFYDCTQNLEDRNDSTLTFNIDLTTSEKVILSNLLLIEWLTKEVNDVLQMSLHLNDRDFKTYSESKNLYAKRQHLTMTKEEVEKQITAYGYKNVDWSTLG